MYLLLNYVFDYKLKLYLHYTECVFIMQYPLDEGYGHDLKKLSLRFYLQKKKRKFKVCYIHDKQIKYKICNKYVKMQWGKYLEVKYHESHNL